MQGGRNTHKLPFDPARWPFFYGWFILFAAVVGTVCSVPGQTFGVSAFTEPLIASLELNRTLLSTAYMLGTIGSAFFLTWGGRLYDRLGARVTAVISGAGLGLVLLYLSRIDDVAAELARALNLSSAKWTAVASITLGFLCLRFTGQGMLTIVSRNMVMKWFDQRRGLANGIIGVFIPIFFSASPLFFDHLIEALGWRGAWTYIGITLILGVTVFALIFYRDNPEACGLSPDGTAGSAETTEKQGTDRSGDYTLSQARRTHTFWVFNLTVALHAFYMTALTFHIVSVFSQAGIGESRAFAIFIPCSVISVVIGMVLGWISDHIRLKYPLWVLIGGMLLSMAGIFVLNNAPGYYMVIAGNGLAGSTFGLLQTVSWPRFFGRTHLGAISGFHMSWVVAFSAVGPFFFGLAYEHLDSYLPAVAGCVCVLVILFLLSIPLREPDLPDFTETWENL